MNRPTASKFGSIQGSIHGSIGWLAFALRVGERDLRVALRRIGNAPRADAGYMHLYSCTVRLYRPIYYAIYKRLNETRPSAKAVSIYSSRSITLTGRPGHFLGL